MNEMNLEKYKVYEGLIIDITEDGEGVAKLEGFTVFANGGTIGDTVKIKITQIKKSFAKGEVVGIISESDFKVKAKCRHFAKCGGCDLQDVDYSKQMEIKTNIVKNALERIGKIQNADVKPCIGMENPWNYRNKVVFHVEGAKIGLKGKNSNTIIEISECPILPSEIMKVMIFVRGIVKEFAARKAPFALTTVMIRRGNSPDDAEKLMVDFRVESTSNNEVHRSANLIKQKIGQTHDRLKELGVGSVNISTKSGSELVYGKSKLSAVIGNKKFMVAPHSFLQVNDIQAENLYGKVVELGNINDTNTLLDIYSGVGVISLIAGSGAKAVYGVESWVKAVEDATENAILNGMEEKSKFFPGKAEIVTKELIESGDISKPDIIIVDPPRSGCEAPVLELIGELSPEKLIYVSCKPSTLARDLKQITSAGYEVKHVQPYDMFCHSVHVETVVLMSRKDK